MLGTRIGSFDAHSWNGVALLTDDFSVMVRFGAFFDGKLIDGGMPQYEQVSRVGPCAPDGGYAWIQWDLSASNRLTLEWSGDEESGLIAGHLHFEGGIPLNLFAEVFSPWHPDLAFQVAGATVDVGPARVILFEQPLSTGTYASVEEFQKTFLRRVPTFRTSEGHIYGSEADEAREEELIATTGPLIYARTLPPSDGHGCAVFQYRPFSPGSDLYFAIACDRADAAGTDAAWAKTTIEAGRRAYAARRVTSSGALGDAAEAITQCMFWNNLYAPQVGRILPSIDRTWAQRWGGWVIGEWDCFFHALLTALEDRRTPRDAAMGIIHSASELGFLPNIAAGEGISPDRSQPPIGSFVVWKLYQRTGDRSLLEETYGPLVRWHDWWFSVRPANGLPYRDGNQNGLLEWGSEQMGRDLWCGGSGGIIQAKWESGTDDSPIFDDCRYLLETSTLDMDCVDLSALWALDAEMLSLIAAELNRTSDAVRFRRDWREMGQRINASLWDEAAGAYKNRFFDGRWCDVLTPMNFYPLLAGVATPERAARMVEHLQDEEEFWGEYVIPTVWKRDLAFTDQHYWRGSIWGPTNYLVYQGLRRCGFHDVCAALAEKSLALFMRNWEADHHWHESYLASGEGSALPHYTWGTLLALIAVEELVDADAWRGIQFGALKAHVESTVNRVPLRGDQYRVTLGPHGLEVRRNGTVWLRTDRPARVTGWQLTDRGLRFTIESQEAITLSLPGVPPNAQVTADGVAQTPSPSLAAGSHVMDVRW